MFKSLKVYCKYKLQVSHCWAYEKNHKNGLYLGYLLTIHKLFSVLYNYNGYYYIVTGNLCFNSVKFSKKWFKKSYCPVLPTSGQ